MATILDTIAEYTRCRVAEKKKNLPLEEMRERALAMNHGSCGKPEYPFEKALSAAGICKIFEG